DGLRIQAVAAAKICLRADNRRKPISQTHASELPRGSAVFKQRFSDQPAEAAFHGVFFQRNDAASFAGSGEDGSWIERANCVEAQNTRLNVFSGEGVGDFEGFFNNAAGGDDG